MNKEKIQKLTQNEIKKIYIIGSVATGKTTLAKHLSRELNINYYSLDKVIWDDDNNHTKRTKKEINKLFKSIINKEAWIIEDVGRKDFILGREEADLIYFLSLKKRTIYFRIIKRWFKQKLKLEEFDYKPTIKSLFEMFGWAQEYNKKKEMEIYNAKLIILTEKELKEFYKEV